MKENWKTDGLSGLQVFLLALPLSLGIAQASGFPPMMGLITAMIGGMVAGPLSGSLITIKGPAAGLIVLVAGAVAQFGGGAEGWRYALAAIAIAGALQVLFGWCRLGKLTDLFPLAVVHGMLAGIGLMIISRQLHVLLNIDPAQLRGKDFWGSLMMLPRSLVQMNMAAAGIGALCLAVMLGWPLLKWKVSKKIPPALVALGLAIPAAWWLNLSAAAPAHTMVHIGRLADSIGLQLRFPELSKLDLLVRYVVMFAVVGSLESLLTVKAMDSLDPYRRRSNPDKDLVALGIGNIVSGVLGGLPMIAEVARSSANVANGARTRWANIFHGLWMLLFVLLAAPLIELIPASALAAMLIAVGIRLAHPKAFRTQWQIGREQLLVFIVTITATVSIDLLTGIVAGILCEAIVNMANGKPRSALLQAPTALSFEAGRYVLAVDKAAVFSNFMSIRNRLNTVPEGSKIVIDLKATSLIDHTAMENLHHFKQQYESSGGMVKIVGLQGHRPVSNHKMAARKKLRGKHKAMILY